MKRRQGAGVNRGRAAVAGALAAACAALGTAGCSDRILTIDVADFIAKTPGQPNGTPIEVDIVCVLPSDFKKDLKERNKDLLPGSTITSEQWFQNKPTKESMTNPAGGARYQIPSERIISYAEKPELYGKYAGGRIRGAKAGGQARFSCSKTIPVKDIHDSQSAIYVFARFPGKTTSPAVFSPIGAYTRDIAVYIGEDGVYRSSEPKAHEGDVKKNPGPVDPRGTRQ